MGGFVFAKIFVVKNFVEDAVGVPGCAAADKFAIGGAERVEDGVVEFLVVCHEVEFVCIDYIKRWASDCFGVVGESFNAASVNKMNPDLLGLKDEACG